MPLNAEPSLSSRDWDIWVACCGDNNENALFRVQQLEAIYIADIIRRQAALPVAQRLARIHDLLKSLRDEESFAAPSKD